MTTDTYPGAAYAALPEPIAYQIAVLQPCEHGDALVGWRVEPSRQSFDASMRPKRKLYTEGDMHDFADRTHALRASHGQASAQAAPAAVEGPIGYGPKVTVRRSCSDCKACNSESYAVQGDSGHYVYCEHPSLPERKYIGDTRWDTPGWCPAAAPTTQPTPAAQGDALTQAARDVLAERQRQISVYGLTPERDDAYRQGELSAAAGCYALYNWPHPTDMCPVEWPWAPEWWKPTNYRRSLEKAGALILAELERIDRAAQEGK